MAVVVPIVLTAAEVLKRLGLLDDLAHVIAHVFDSTKTWSEESIVEPVHSSLAVGPMKEDSKEVDDYLKVS